MIIEVNDKKTKISKRSCILPGSYIIGDVEIKDNVIVLFNCSIRGDEDKIIINKGTNIQDNTVIHTDKGYPTIVGKNVTIGHSCIIHGATIKDNVIIGMGSIILNGAFISENVIIGANSLITQNKKLEPNSLYIGSPAKKVRELTEEELKEIKRAADIYQEMIEKYKKYSIV